MDNLHKFLLTRQTTNLWAWFWWGMVFSIPAEYYFSGYVKGFRPWHIFFGAALSVYLDTLYTELFWKVIKDNMSKGKFYSMNEIYFFFQGRLSEMEIMQEFDKSVEKGTAQKLQHDRNLNYRLL